MIAQLYVVTKIIGDIALQVNFLACELYLNKPIKKKKNTQKDDVCKSDCVLPGGVSSSTVETWGADEGN